MKIVEEQKSKLLEKIYWITRRNNWQKNAKTFYLGGVENIHITLGFEESDLWD